MAFYIRYPAAGGASSNPANGTIGTPAGTIATQVSAQDPSGNVAPLKVDASGNLLVDLSIPSGIATAANQTNGNQKSQIVDGSGNVIGSSSILGLQRLNVSLAAGGTPGATAPNYTDVIGAVDSSTGFAQQLQVDSSKNLKVGVQSSVLPTGAATSALQTTGNTSLNSIDTKTPALGQALAAASVPVVLPAAQITTLTPPTTVTVTQATGSNLHTVVDSGTVTANAGTGTFAVSAASLPLPTGASTAANQTNVQSSPGTSATTALTVQGSASGVAIPVSGTVTITPSGTQAVNLSQVGGSAISIGQQLSAASLPAVLPAAQVSALTPYALGAAVTASSVPVNIASDQVVPMVLNDLIASGTITTQNLVPGGTATAGSAVAIALNGKGTVTIQVTGTYTGALSPQVTTDGVNWITQGGAVLQNMATGASAATIPSAGVGIWQIEVNGHAQFRITALAAVTGTATITLRAAAGTSQVSATVAGVATAANQTNVQSAPGTAQTVALTIQGNASGIAVPVSGTVSTTVAGLSISNAPFYNNYGTTAVNTGAYVQFIASTTSATKFVDIFDSSGQSMIFAVGGAGSEVAQIYVAPGGGSYSLAIPAGSRIAYQALTGNATSGYVTINLRG